VIEGGLEFAQIAVKKLAIQLFASVFTAFAILHISASLNAHTGAASTPRRKEARQMPSPRWLARLSIPMIVGAALVTSNAIAVADATDDTFLTKMHTLGFTWPAGDDSDIVAMGHQICADRMAGKTPDATAADIHSTLGAKGITFADVTSMVSAAESTYCPG
jgi:Protein of unknown function (DUF732)